MYRTPFQKLLNRLYAQRSIVMPDSTAADIILLLSLRRLGTATWPPWACKVSERGDGRVRDESRAESLKVTQGDRAQQSPNRTQWRKFLSQAGKERWNWDDTWMGKKLVTRILEPEAQTMQNQSSPTRFVWRTAHCLLVESWQAVDRESRT